MVMIGELNTYGWLFWSGIKMIFKKKKHCEFLKVNGVGGQLYEKGNMLFIQFTPANDVHKEEIKVKLLEV